MEHAIRLQGVSKYYKLYDSPRDRLKEALTPASMVYHRKYYALDGVDLSVDEGEILGIVGRNGAGKSTLLKIIAGVLQPSSGSVSVRGKISALLELGSGFNPQFTGHENIFFYGTILGFTREQMNERLDDIIAFADIGDFINQPMNTYSSGMRARLGFAVAVHIDPEILILDEVLSVGDLLFKRKCHAKMEEFFNGGKTILYVSHNADSVNQLCTRAVLLEGGQITADDEPKAVTAYYQKKVFAAANPGVRAEDESVERSGDEIMISSDTDADTVNQVSPIRHPQDYIGGMEPKSTVKLRNDEVDILNARILDEAGREVNLLHFDGQYTFCVEMAYGVAADSVAFGFAIRDIKGVSVATIESYKMYLSGTSYDVKPGDRYKLTYRFRCRLRTGMYFISCGTSSFDSEQRVLCRIVDMVSFKVLNNEGLSSGYVDLIDTIEIHKDRGESNTIKIQAAESI